MPLRPELAARKELRLRHAAPAFADAKADEVPACRAEKAEAGQLNSSVPCPPRAFPSASTASRRKTRKPPICPDAPHCPSKNSPRGVQAWPRGLLPPALNYPRPSTGPICLGGPASSFVNLLFRGRVPWRRPCAFKTFAAEFSSTTALRLASVRSGDDRRVAFPARKRIATAAPRALARRRLPEPQPTLFAVNGDQSGFDSDGGAANRWARLPAGQSALTKSATTFHVLPCLRQTVRYFPVIPHGPPIRRRNPA